jgi:murein DD-endopeptidase MepM/ murein hydrolase activator NlpD
MKQEYFVVVLAHSLRGRLRRIHIPHQAVYAVLAFALFGCFSLFGFVASYARMALKVANYNALRREADGLRSRYQSLANLVSQKDEQLASLQLYAKEVSVAFGIKQKLEGPADIMAEGKLVPSYAESIEDYDYLRKTRMIALGSKSSQRMGSSPRPSLWPVEGRLILSSYGQRLDPFSGEGAFHKGVDISAATGTSVRAAADGIVVHAEWASGGYGRLVVIDHGGGLQTFYAHLSKISVRAGQGIRRGEQVGEVGSSGRVTAPHLHYEVRMAGAPVNPSKFLERAAVFQPVPEKVDFPF